MPLDADIYGRKESLVPSLAVSTVLHGALLACVLLLPGIFSHNGDAWGNNGNGGEPGGAMSAHLVSGIPLPPNPQAKPENVLANESKGLSQSVPAPVSKPDDNAIAIPDRNTKVKPPKQKPVASTSPQPNPREVPKQRPTVPTPSREKPREMAKLDNSIPFGGGGPAAGPFTTFQSGGTSGGMKFGEGGTGSFGSRFGWYTEVVARKVHQAWQSEVNPSVSSAKRVYILFDISRSGRPSNVRIEQSSGIPALDTSAVRTLQRIDTFGDLPREYNGSYVSVEFWFDYRR